MIISLTHSLKPSLAEGTNGCERLIIIDESQFLQHIAQKITLLLLLFAEFM